MMRVLWICLLLTGCARLSPGPVQTLASTHPPAVILIRGYRDWYSTGIDQLSDQLNKAGISAQTFREEQWESVADTLCGGNQSRLILIGFSYGADDVILIARRLNQIHQPVSLLITIDPVTPATIPPNVQQCVDFYQPNGIWDIFPWLRGVPVSSDAGARIENINVRARADLNEPDTSHATIAANPKIHGLVVKMILQCSD